MPCLNIMVSAPFHPQIFIVITLAHKNLIWDTEEYAIKDFISIWRRQIKHVTIAPHKKKIINIRKSKFKIIPVSIIRARPYVPNFKITPARITDPATGASTWALGNHICSM